MSNSAPKISVVIPVKNGASWLDACLQGIMQQTLFHQTEIIVVDSGSTDGSIELLQKYPVRLYKISPTEFNHGLTRNYGAQLSNGEYVVMTVQDARPADEYWLENLLKGFSVAENVAGVCGSQVVPHERDKNPVDWFRPVGAPTIICYQFKSSQEFEALPPSKKMQVCGWDDVTAMYKKSVLLKIPFHDINCSEDAIWAKEVLMAGYTLVYNQHAKVYHYHHGDREFTFRRTLQVMHLRYKQFGFVYSRPSQSLRQWLSMIKLIVKAKPLTWKEKWQWVRYNHEQLKGFQKAYTVFTEALAEGEENLDAVHEHFCGQPQMHQKAIFSLN